MKEDINSIDKRYEQRIKSLEAMHNRERIKDFIITIAISVVVFACAFTLIYYGPTINNFLKSLF